MFNRPHQASFGAFLTEYHWLLSTLSCLISCLGHCSYELLHLKNHLTQLPHCFLPRWNGKKKSQIWFCHCSTLADLPIYLLQCARCKHFSLLCSEHVSSLNASFYWYRSNFWRSLYIIHETWRFTQFMFISDNIMQHLGTINFHFLNVWSNKFKDKYVMSLLGTHTQCWLWKIIFKYWLKKM